MHVLKDVIKYKFWERISSLQWNSFEEFTPLSLSRGWGNLSLATPFVFQDESSKAFLLKTWMNSWKKHFTPEYLQTDFKTKRWWELKLNEVPVLPTLKAERLVSVETFRKCLFLSEPSKWISLSCYMDLSKLLNWFVKVVTLICQSCSLYFLPFAGQNQTEVLKISKLVEAFALNYICWISQSTQCLRSIVHLAMSLW